MVDALGQIPPVQTAEKELRRPVALETAEQREETTGWMYFFFFSFQDKNEELNTLKAKRGKKKRKNALHHM